MAEPVSIEIGLDRFAPQFVAERCKAQGLSVELLLMDTSGNARGIAALIPHRLLVDPEDLEEVRALIPEWMDQADST